MADLEKMRNILKSYDLNIKNAIIFALSWSGDGQREEKNA
jgi:hypothetical protein